MYMTPLTVLLHEPEGGFPSLARGLGPNGDGTLAEHIAPPPRSVAPVRTVPPVDWRPPSTARRTGPTPRSAPRREQPAATSPEVRELLDAVAALLVVRRELEHPDILTDAGPARLEAALDRVASAAAAVPAGQTPSRRPSS